MLSINVLNLKTTDGILEYSLEIGGLVGVPIITGAISCLHTKRYTNGTAGEIWDDIKSKGIPTHTDSITYIIRVVTGGSSLTYVGKTLNTLARRYPGEVGDITGGLKLVFDTFLPGDSTVECVLYNCSHPALIENLCYQYLEAKDYELANKTDPS